MRATAQVIVSYFSFAVFVDFFDCVLLRPNVYVKTEKIGVIERIRSFFVKIIQIFGGG